MFKKKLIAKIIAVVLNVCMALCCSACGNGMFASDAEMQVVVRGAYASTASIGKNGGSFLIVEDDGICSIDFFNGLLGQDGDPIYTCIPLNQPIKKRDYKNGKVVTQTKTYRCEETDTMKLTTNLVTEKDTYSKIKQAGNILLSNAEHFSVTDTYEKNSVFNTKLYGGRFMSDITSKAVLLRFSFYDENYNTVQETKFFYCYQINVNTENVFSVEIGRYVNTNYCVLIAYYI